MLVGLLLAGCGGSSGFDDGAQASRLSALQGGGSNPDAGGPTAPGVGPGTGPPVPFNPGEQTGVLYITESQDGTLGIYDAETYAALAEVPVGTDPSGLSFDTARDRILVGLFAGTLLSLDANEPDQAPLSVTAVPSASRYLIYDPPLDGIWVSSFNFIEKLAALAAETLTPLSNSPMTDSDLLGSSNLALDPDGVKLYVTQNAAAAAAVSVVDRTTRVLLSHVSTVNLSGDLNDAAIGVAYHPEFDVLYVGNSDGDTDDDDTVAVLDAGQDPPVVLQHVPCGQGPSGIAVDLTHSRVYVTNANSPTGGLTVYGATDTGTPLTFQQTLPTGLQPLSVLYDSERDRVLVTNFGEGTLSVFDADTLDELSGSPFPVGEGANQLLLRPGTP